MVVVVVIQVEYVKGFNLSSCRIFWPDGRYCHCCRVRWLFAVHGWRDCGHFAVMEFREAVHVRTSSDEHDGAGPRMISGG